MSFDLDMTEELEHRDWVRQQRISAASRAPAPGPFNRPETAAQQLDRERAGLGPNLALAMHRRARKLGLLPQPERVPPVWPAVLIAVGVALVAMAVLPGVGHG